MAVPLVGIFNGYTGPIQQKWSVKYSPTTGGQSEINILGFDVNQMLTLAGQQATAGIECDLSFSHNVAELTLRTSDPTYQGFGSVFNSIVDRWEVEVDDEKPSLLENPSYLSMFTNVNATYGVAVDQQVSQVIIQTCQGANPTYQTLWSNLKAANLTQASGVPFSGSGPAFPGQQPPYYVPLSVVVQYLSPPIFDSSLTTPYGLKFFFEEYARGRTNYVHGKYTLKHTTMAPSTYAANVADFNVETIYSIGQLLSEVQNNNLWILPLPGYLAYKILNYPVPLCMPETYTWGALKMRSNAVVAARGRIEITQQYLIDAIAVPTYGLI